jgi:Flp pilus assembly protein TadG
MMLRLRSNPGWQRDELGRRRASTSKNRPAVCAIEVVLALPIFLVFLLAVVEFGLILANCKQVSLASRVGAKIASESSFPFDATTLVNIRTAVDRQLESAGLGATASGAVVLQHNVAGGGASPQSSGPLSCTAPTDPPLPSDGEGAVRVTVCVELSKLTPNFLSTFGFSTAGKRVMLTTTYPYK